MKTKKERLPGAFAWSIAGASTTVEYLLIAKLTYALTESYGMSATIVGLIFLVSRLFDGFSDVVAGYIVDRTNSRFGKTRIYDLMNIPMWIGLILVFSVPNIGLAGKIIWVFFFYNLVQSVFVTFMNLVNPMRLQRTYKEDQRVRISSVSTVITMFFTVISSIMLPVFIGKFGNEPHGWTIISLIFAIPFGIFGTIKFFLPELPEYMEADKKTEPIKIKDSLKALIQNKYALLFGGVMICWAMYNTFTSSSSSYYFNYVYGDVAAESIVSMVSMLQIFSVALITFSVNKIGKVNTVRIGLTLIVIASTVRLVMPNNIMWLSICNLFCACGILALGFMKGLLNIDCIAYGKWKTGNGIEAAYSTVNSVADKVGLGVGSFLLGIILQIGGYDASLSVQGASTLFTIKMLYTVIPAILALAALILLAFFDLEKKLPGIENDLQKKN